MSITTIDIATHRVRERHAASPQVVVVSAAPTLAHLPAVLRRAGDQFWLGREEAPARPGGTLGWIVSRWGESWLQGEAAQVRYAFALPGRRFFLPVHYAAADAEGLDLIGLEPRWLTACPDGRREDCIELGVRLGAAPTAASGSAPAGGEPWQELARALARETARPGEGIALLAQGAQRAGLHPLMHALFLRNLAVGLLRRQAWDEALAVLHPARLLYPGYRELDYLEARLELGRGRAAAAIPCLQRATAPNLASPWPFVGSGGESGYRAHYWLALLAEQTGRQAVALHHFVTGMRQAPAYRPSVAGILRQRLPGAAVEALQWDFSRLARREPDYQRPVFDFLLLHQAWATARRMLTACALAPAVEAEMEARLGLLSPLYRAAARPPDGPAGVVLEGPLATHSSVARINRYLAGELLADASLDVALAPTTMGTEPVHRFPRSPAWSAGLWRVPRRLDLTIRHGWPPDFTPPATGKLVLILPWEFGAIPRVWRKKLEAVDEVWVPSRFGRTVLVRAGVAEERIQVIPNGVDGRLFRAQGDVWRPVGARAVNFLFVGGAIRRKGVDLLLRAWREAFGPGDDVSLTIQELGGQSFYRHLSLGEEIRKLATDRGVAPVLYRQDEWSEERLPALYRGSDVVVLPYRGEGFGMPLAEGLACGKPVITTQAGPAPEFCPAEASWMISAEEAEMPRGLWPPGEMSGPVTWFEPSFPELVQALCAAARDPRATAARGMAGAARIHATHGWAGILKLYRQRVAALTGAGVAVEV